MWAQWSDAAFDQLTAIYAYVSERNPSAANRLIEALFEAADSLADSPYRGRAGAVPQTRELIVRGTYILVYEVFEDRTVRVLQVWHGAQNRPR